MSDYAMKVNKIEEDNNFGIDLDYCSLYSYGAHFLSECRSSLNMEHTDVGLNRQRRRL